ncbi:outer membrane biogenesis protein BamB [Rubripirellula tenax]|uniref:Outer membrane biogenesis protein BamB n=1 Tax=Rubripirellula tenax TaxID=2528015 RepID=A0A5C6F5Y8_9BACT|nr:PQQ-binding-like beta-propeller repeat protein [Rubripirellula tenax]TWU56768.1 outer membrane biogenesis protein BamB [Rubripirellula tenax]
MFKKEISTWAFLLFASLLGSATTVALSGCTPPPIPEANTSTALDDDPVDSNVTATNSNVTTAGGPSAAVDLPMALVPPKTMSTKAAVALVSTTSADTTETSAPEDVQSAGGDWPQWGGTRMRNNAPGVTGLPEEWNIGKFDRRSGEWDNSKAANIRWYANLGSQTYGNPVVSGGHVYVGTNNGAGHIKRYPSEVDLGCLLAFDEKNGEFLWQHSSEKLITGRVHDWPLQGICCAPLVEGNRLWFVTSRGEVRCLDTEGFYDGEDDGPVKDEAANVAEIMNAGPAAAAHAATLASLAEGKLSDAAKAKLAEAGEPLEGDAKVETVTADKVWKATGNFGGVDRTITMKQIGPKIMFIKSLGVDDKRDADVVWVFDMMGPTMGVSQHNMCACSVTSYGDLLFVNTSNGLDESHINLPAPDAPSFICMDKNTGEVIWTDSSPGRNILHGQWSSPAVAELGGVAQALFAGGDGILYSFAADRGKDGKPELLWKFDCNPKTTVWKLGGEGTRNNLIATPVAYDGRVYIAVGQDPEHGEGEGHLWCIDPTKRGDVSPTLAMKLEDGKRVPIEHRRVQAVEPEDGEVEVDNPNSAVVWHYSMFDSNGDDEIDFEEEMHRSIGTCAIKDDVLYVADFSGLVHCLDAKGTKDGKPIVHFTYDMLAQSWGSALITDGRVFIGDEDGDVAIFEFGPEHNEPMDEINMGSSVYSTPVAANKTIFVSTKDKLFAIGETD